MPRKQMHMILNTANPKRGTFQILANTGKIGIDMLPGLFLFQKWLAVFG